MTDLEIAQIFQELRGAGLANEPRDAAGAIKIWRDFFGGEDPRVIGKAVWIHMRNSQFWPTPKDIVKLKQKAEWLVELDQKNYLEAQQKKLMPPTAPNVNIRNRAETFCDLCELCDEKDQDKCPFDF